MSTYLGRWVCAVGWLALCAVSGACEKAPPVEEPATRAACIEQGGDWGTFGLLDREACDMPTRDAGCRCTSSEGCQSVCVTNDSVLAGTRAIGMCFGRTITQGTCLNQVENGVAQGTVCED